MTSGKNKRISTGMDTREIERRKAKRIPILASFSISLVVPKKGMHRLHIYDVSEKGIGFILNIEEEFSSSNPTEVNDLLEINLYLNSSLFLPLSIRVVRIDDTQTGERRIGAKFEKRDSETFTALLAFLTFLDKILGSVVLAHNSTY
ncbi:MAG: PilZ domain-containing protein [Bdellovibrionia bacterium]